MPCVPWHPPASLDSAGFKIRDPYPGSGDTKPSGFYMRFANGWTVSVQFGSHHYCSPNKDGTSPNAEIAAWDQNNVWHDFGDDQVAGHCAPDDVLTFMNMIAGREGG